VSVTASSHLEELATAMSELQQTPVLTPNYVIAGVSTVLGWVESWTSSQTVYGRLFFTLDGILQKEQAVVVEFPGSLPPSGLVTFAFYLGENGPQLGSNVPVVRLGPATVKANFPSKIASYNISCILVLSSYLAIYGCSVRWLAISSCVDSNEAKPFNYKLWLF